MKYRKFRIELIVGMIVVALLDWKCLSCGLVCASERVCMGAYEACIRSYADSFSGDDDKMGRGTSACNSSIPYRNICGNLAYSSLILHLQGNCWKRFSCCRYGYIICKPDYYIFLYSPYGKKVYG